MPVRPAPGTARARRARRQRSCVFRALRSPHPFRVNGPVPATPLGRRAQPRECPRIPRPNLIRPSTSGQFLNGREPARRWRIASLIRIPPCSGDALPGGAPDPPARPANACGTPPRDPELTVREAGFASRTGPPPAGNGAAISPSPCVQHSGPIHAAPMQAPARWPGQSARTGARPHTGVHARAPPNRPRESPRGHREHGPPVRPPAPVRAGRRAVPRRTPRNGRPPWAPRTRSAAAGGGPAPRPGSLHAPSAPPPHFPHPPFSLPPSCVRPCSPVDLCRSHPPYNSPRAAGTDNNPAIRTSGP